MLSMMVVKGLVTVYFVASSFTFQIFLAKQEYKPGRLDAYFEVVANHYNLDKNLLESIAYVESRYNPKAVSKTGDKGLMQLSPLITRFYKVKDPFNSLQSIIGAAKLLNYLKIKTKNIKQVIAAYNGGLRRSRSWKRNKILRNYVYLVTRAYKNYEQE